MRKFLALLLTASQLGGCASIFSNSAFPVYVESAPQPAEFVITNRNGVEVGRGQTPATIILESGAGYFDGADYTVHFSKPGHDAVDYGLRSYLNWVYYTNIFNIVGFFIDPATGAMWRMPQEVSADLSPLPGPRSGTRGR